LARGGKQIKFQERQKSTSAGSKSTSTRSRSLATAAIAAVVAFVGFPVTVAAQGPSGDAEIALHALRLMESERIDLDGHIDEAPWSRATPISDFTQQEPSEGAQPSRETEVRVVYDRDHLYIGAIIYDDPEEILAFQRQRDAGLGTDDRFMWVLDTFRDGRTGYFFETNAAGLLGDGIITGSGGGRGGGFGVINKAWDGIWEVRTTRRPDGWSAEIRIPFRTLNFDPNADSWGINFQRTIRRTNEEILWRGFRLNQGLFRLVFAGRLTGLSEVSQGIGLETRLSAIGGWRNTPADTDPTTFPSNVSMDLNYSVTPSLRASVSLNTDFAEVESDQRRVNLTRFPLFFPERRDFFLEGSGVFTFAPRSGPRPFFSRRIGLRGGEQVPINYGARLTGQIARAEVGLYQMGTGSQELSDEARTLIPREQFTVARVRIPIFEQSTIGAIYTRRATSADTSGFSPDDRHTVGVDGAYNTRRFFGDYNFEVEAFFVWNSNPDASTDRSIGDLSARGFRLNFPNDVWTAHLSYREFGDDYNPAVGFVTRNDFRRVEPRIGWAPRPSLPWIRQLDFSVQFRNLTELGTGILEEREWRFNLLGVEFESGDNIDLVAMRTFEFLDRPFDVSEGIEIAQGDYTTWRYELRARTSSRRRVSLRGGFALGDFWNGERTEYRANVTVRPNPGVSLQTSFERNQVRLPQGRFSTNLYRIEGSWDPSPWVGLSNQLQYDDVSQVLGLFARFRWILTPGNDIFLVYTHNWRDFGAGVLPDPSPDPDARGFSTVSRGGSVKLNYTYRF